MSIWTGLTIPPAEVLNGAASGAAQRQLALAAERSIVPLTYGEDRVAGLVRNVLPAGAGSKTLLIQVIWGWGCDTIADLLLNDQALPAGSTVTHYTGAQLSADSTLVVAMAAQGIAYASPLTGFAYSVVAIPIKAFSGQLNFTARIRGRRVYDPRQDSTAGGSGSQRLAQPSTWTWSACPALALADWTASTAYGAGLAVDWATVATLANANDALVGGEKRRLIGLTLTEPSDVRTVGEVLRAYAGAWALPGANGVRFVPDADGAAVASYSHADGNIMALAPLELRDTSSAPTVVEVIYTDTSVTPWRDGSAMAMLPGAGTTKPWRLSQVRLPGIQRYSQAMREATERLNKLTLLDMSTTVEVADIGIRHEKADLITLTHPVGLTAKPFRVQDVAMPRPGTWRLSVQEHDPAVYSDTVQTAPSIPNTSLNNPAGPPDAPANLSLSVVPGALRIRRDRSTEVDWAACELRYGASPGTAVAVPADVGRDGADWLWPPTGWITIWARDIDSTGQPSAWVSASRNVLASELLLTGSSITPPPEWLNANVAIPRGTLNADPGLLDEANAWTWDAGIFVDGPSTASGALGVKYFTALTAGEKWAWTKQTFPISSSRTYNLSALLYAAAGNARNMYLVVDMYKVDGTRLTGADTGWGGLFAGYTFGGLPTPGQFTRYGDASDFGAGTARPIPAAAAYFRVGVWFQYADGSGGVQQAAEDIRLVDVTEARAASALATAAQSTASSAASNAAGALSQLATMRSNGYLDAAEKPAVIREWNALAGEQAGIVAQANALGIVAERDTYTGAMAAHAAYLGGLTPSWNDTTQDTPITPAVDQAKWLDVYTARQVLLNKIAAVAATLASWSGVSGAGKPQDNANQTYVDGGGALQGVSSGAGTPVSNNNIGINASGQLYGIGAGSGLTVSNAQMAIGADGKLYSSGAYLGSQVTLSGLGARAMALIDKITSANVTSYIDSASIQLANINIASIGTLSALSSFLGTVEIAAGGFLRAGQTDYATGTGFFLGYSGGEYCFSIGDGSNWLRYKPSQGLSLKLSTYTATVGGGSLSPIAGALGTYQYGTASVTVSGGTPPYSYAWSVSRDTYYPNLGTNEAWVSGSGASVNVYGRSTNANQNTVLVKCTVTDSNGRSAVGDTTFIGQHGSFVP